MKSNYSLLKDLPEFKRTENFSHKKENFPDQVVVEEKLPSLQDILMNIDSLKQTMMKHEEMRANINQRINDETNEEFKNQYIKNLGVLDKISSTTNENMNKYKNLLLMVDKKELIDMMETLSSKPNLTKYDSRVLDILKSI